MRNFLGSFWLRAAAPAFACLLALSLAAPPGASAQESVYKLASLSSLYNEVEFDHELHVDVAEDCAVCHHHTLGQTPLDKACQPCHSDGKKSAKVACGQCHAAEPFSAENLREQHSATRYHLDVPGLKAVYHLNCLGCHQENGAPTGCGDCHARKDSGDAFFHSGKYAPTGGHASKHGE